MFNKIEISLKIESGSKIVILLKLLNMNRYNSLPSNP